ncbi:hypothetical protein N7475_000238 [Penicillium sp. IBT 31633x]|nr:hypothetical protein N7475_000238 [Penicillium sp. IBT 31633x]
MGFTCCGPSVPAPEPDVTSSAAEPEETSGCKNSCCDGANAEPFKETTPGQEMPNQERSDGFYSPGKCADRETENDIDVPDCCRGKVGPCCDTSCLDRLAMRASAMSAAPGSTGQPNASDRKTCNQNTLSVLDRYGATLQALGCICRSLIALGEETCCEVRERHSLGGKQGPSISSASSPLRLSLDSMRSNRSLAKGQTQNPPRLQRVSGESARSVKNQSADACIISICSKDNPTTGSLTQSKSSMCCSEGKLINQLPTKSNDAGSCGADDKPIQEAPSKQKCSSSCCSGNEPTELPSNEVNCTKSCHSLENSANHPATRTGNLEFCRSETVRIDESAAKVGCSNSHRFGDHSDKDSDDKGPLADSCCLNINPVVEPPTSACVGSCCGTSKNTITNEPLIAHSSGSCCKSSKQDIVQTPKTSSTTFCCPGIQPVSPQGSCADACCSSAAPEPVPGIDKSPFQDVTDIENQGTGKEFVVLCISGMTCTGCETKLKRTLGSVPAVEDLKTSLVLSRAEFNVDLRLGSVEQIMKHLERTTEFKCERVQNHGFSLDLIVPDDLLKLINQPWPEGVIDMAIVDKQTVRVVFDPKVVGARDFTEKIWGPPIELAPLRGDLSLEAGNKHVRHVGYMTLLSAVLTIPVLVMAWAPLPERDVAYSSASLALATIVQVVIAGPFYPKALKALLFSRVIEMDLLIVLSTTAAYIFSVVSFGYLIAEKPLSTGQFFETSTLLVTLIMVGRWVAALTRQRAVESISIRSLQASTAILVDEESGREREIDARLLQYGDTFKVLPDTQIPTDGTVITGSSEVDESMLTGESRPVEKYPESVVIAGSINGPGVINVRLNRLPSENTIHTIAAMVDEAKLSKPKLQDLADRVAAYFVPIIVALTIITFVIWVAVGMTIRGYDGSEATIQAITYAITVLIVSCPCAIGLAVPMVIVISSGIAAERGIIFKSADAIELAHKTAHVVFDKTGTLTRGKLSVVAQDCVDGDKLPILLGLIENSRHPVSVSVASHLKDAGVIASTVPGSKSLTGKGVEAVLGDQGLRAGNSRWLDLSDHELVQPMLARGYTVFCFTIENDFVAVYGLEDELRPDAAGTIENLKMRGVSVHVVSGDDDGAVQTLASKLGIPGNNMRSRSSPSDKKDYIQKLLDDGTGRKESVVVFCGDGTNDAVALARATIGVHMNEGTDVAQSAADVVLMRPSLAGIPAMMNVSRKAVNRIKFNFTWSFVYNTFAVLLAAGAFVNARIPPEFAGLGELVSVLPVIAAAVLLRWSKI